MVYPRALKELQKSAPGVDAYSGRITDFKACLKGTILAGFDWDNKRLRGFAGFASLLLVLWVIWTAIVIVGSFITMIIESFFIDYVLIFGEALIQLGILIFLQTLLLMRLLLTDEQKQALKALKDAEGHKDDATAQAESARMLAQEPEALHCISTVAAVLYCYEDHLRIACRKNLYTLLFGRFLAGDKTFYYADLTSLQFRRVGWIFKGYLELEYPGAHSGHLFGSFFSENAFLFSRKHESLMLPAYDYIRERVQAEKNARRMTSTAC